MADPLSASRLVSALRAEGCRVKEYRSWRTHNRNHMGDWGPINGVMIHHTVTSGTDASVRLCYEGHSSLPGPLCHGVIAKDGTVWLVGNGRANHAGLGDDDVLRAVIAERDLPPDNEANTDGNARFYGFECVNLGDGADPWPAAQLEAIERASAAICRAYGWSARSVIGHLEWQPGKIDPRGFSMDSMRRRIADRLSRDPDDEHDQEDDVPAYLALGLTGDTTITVPRGKWTTLHWNTEYSDPLGEHWDGDGAGRYGQTFAAGPGRYTGTAYLQVRGLTPGAQLQARLVEDDDAGRTVQEHPVGEGVGSDGSTFCAFPVTGYVGSGRRVKLRVTHYGDEPITLHDCHLKVLVWDR